MRLSMLEHEEQQRKDAEEKRRREAAEGSGAAPASGGESNSSGGVGPSNLSVQSPSQQGRASPIRQTGKKPRSISRSRTPPPSNPVLPLSAEYQATWRNRHEGPRQFSTPRAALPTTPNGLSTLQATVDASSSNADDPSSIPTITIAQDSDERNQSTAADSSSLYADAPLPPLPVESVPSTLSFDERSTSSTSSSFGSLETGSPHIRSQEDENLGSSPRSSLLNSDVTGLRKPFVKETSTMHVEGAS
jgi:hypothetical protein